MPIQVYLDCSDFSYLASDGGASCNALRRALSSFVENKKIQIRYSGITLLESAHNHQDHRKYAIARARIMEELCRGKTLPLFTDLHRIERDSINAKINTKRSVYRENDQWLFDPIELAGNLFEQFAGGIHEALGVTTRQDRRRIRKDLVKNGILRKKYQKILQSSMSAFSPEILRKYPVLKSYPIESEIQGLLIGRISDERFSMNLSSGLLSPVPFTEYLYDMYRGTAGSQEDIVRSFGASFVDVVKMFRDEVSKLIEIGETLGKTDKQIKQKIRSLSEGWLGRRNRVLVDIYVSEISGEPDASEDEIRSMVQGITPGALPGFDLMLHLSWQSACQKALDKRAGLPSSDGGDILHANYLPYVDVFRADKRMRPILQSLCVEHRINTKIAESIEDVVSIVGSWESYHRSKKNRQKLQ